MSFNVFCFIFSAGGHIVWQIGAIWGTLQEGSMRNIVFINVFNLASSLGGDVV